MTVPTGAAFVVAFAGSVGLWWLYFDRSAQASAEVIAASDDPGRLGRSAYHLIHPVMVAGIIVTAAGDEKILTGVAVLAAGGLAASVLPEIVLAACVAVVVTAVAAADHRRRGAFQPQAAASSPS